MPEPSRSPEAGRSSSLSDLQIIAGLAAGFVGIIYVTGGVVLGLRLLWSNLPGLVVSQLPREFLFSFGAGEVLLPALVIGVLAGLIELGSDDRRLRIGHRRWGDAMRDAGLRPVYLAFYRAAPVALVVPGAIVAVLFDRSIGLALQVFAIVYLAAATLIVLALWAMPARRDGVKQRRADERQLRSAGGRAARGDVGRDGTRPLTPHDKVEIVSGVGAIAVLGAVMAVCGHPRYLGLVGAAAAALLFAMLTVWIRGQAGERYRLTDPDGPKNTRLIVCSWMASALLAVPCVVLVAAAVPLRAAVVCGSHEDDGTRHNVAGRFVGETGDHVYIGDVHRTRIISVPTERVSRLLIGDGADKTANCYKRRASGHERRTAGRRSVSSMDASFARSGR